MTKLINGACRAIEAIIALALAVMVVLVFGNVVLRYGFNSGITVSEEVSRWMFVWLIFLGAIVALKEGAHLGTDMLVSRLGLRGKKTCAFIGHILMLYITWLFLDGSWSQVKINREVFAPVTGSSVAMFYAAGVVFSLVSGALLLRSFWLIVTGQLSENELVMVKESEEESELEELKHRLAQQDLGNDVSVGKKS
ncbi:TRAP-type C4-dicarboxylate transport system permease small subunit [Variovorax boronicumulans]|uniref:TRAP transporter small permease n=1 Tax=Variovorax boronicumulans TaxID=436515 RepID=UPI0027884632|nr:TRAP transporter small permease [Variovorax boronicumulans]MDP9996521.1 TRAP-type C4-dicarboxylate transport system permease small subunit [Variovorax boronicumulans]MDQ0007834.1 TRAP-type C4-dicarboxylate transport system permease small subunit [Variovorax boronicumulans]MDQ0044338.1 TRAP-type C4-dicarboxylate transport system permease small subunit [Variovorax boronicumulans]